MNFLYEAVDEQGLPVFGKIEARTEADAQRELAQRGLKPQSLAPSSGNREQGTGNRREEARSQKPEADPQSAIGNRQSAMLHPQPSILNPQLPSVADRLNTNPAMQEVTSIGTVASAPRPVRISVATASAPVARQQPKVGNITLAGNAAKVQARVTQSKATPQTRPGVMAQAAETSELGGVKTRDMMFFFRQFASLTHSGITLFGALENLAARTPNPNLALTAREMSDVARRGGMISDVMKKYPRIYPEHVTGMVLAGETGGFVEIALSEIADGYDANIKLYRGAWIPKAMALQAFLILPFVIPLFPILFRSFEFQANLAAYLKVVMFVSLPISLAMIGLLLFASKTLQLPQHRHLRDSWSLKVPAIGNLQREVAVRNFLRMLRRLYHAGVAPIHAWEGAMNTASNVVIRDQLARSYELMQSGASLPEAFQATGLFADQVEQMVFTGQQSGQVVEMLDQAQAYYEERVEVATGKARFMMFRMGLLAMMIFGGGAFLWMVKSYFGAMFHVVDTEFGQ